MRFACQSHGLVVGRSAFQAYELDILCVDSAVDVHLDELVVFWRRTVEKKRTRPASVTQGSVAQVMSQHLHKPPPLERLQNVPACLRALVAHMIEKNPLKRPQTPVELRVAIEKCLAQIASEQNFPASIDEARAETQHGRRTRPNAARAILWSIAAVVVLLGFGALLLFKDNWPTGVRAPRNAVTSPFSAPVPSSVPLVVQSASPGTAPASPRAAPSPEEQEVFTYVHSLLDLRKSHAALRTGKQWHIGWDDTYYAFLRELPE